MSSMLRERINGKVCDSVNTDKTEAANPLEAGQLENRHVRQVATNFGADVRSIVIIDMIKIKAPPRSKGSFR